MVHAVSADDSLSIQNIIHSRRLHSVYQAIINTRDLSIIAYEALARGPIGPMQSPLRLFDQAQRCEMTADLEFLCLELACANFKSASTQKLFLNIHPHILFEPQCKTLLLNSIDANPSLAPHNIVLELSEREIITNFDAFQAVLQSYRDIGFGIAIDDLGAAYCGLQRWLELQPDFVKLDRHFSQDIHINHHKADFMRGLIALCTSTNAELIVEGIELREEAELLHNLGVRLMQGYYFHRPGNIIGQRVNVSSFSNNELQALKTPIEAHNNIAALISPSQTLNIDTRLDKVIEAFHAHSDLNAIPLIDSNDLAMGIITRRQALDIYTREFGRELNSRKPIRHFMDTAPLIVESITSLEEASYQLTNNISEDLIQEFIVCEQGRYIGIVKTIDLLRTITEQQIRSARYANPLTLLPGNVPISETISRLLLQQANFWVAYCDINHFKAFNDVYGYSQGDAAITVLADVIKAHCDTTTDFIGHVGGDDFIIVFNSKSPESNCAAICQNFQQEVLCLYDKKALEDGGICSYDRRGNSTFYATMSLSIGLVHPDPTKVTSAHAVSALASDAKKEAKKLADGGVYLSRRRH